MTAASKKTPGRSRCRDAAIRRPGQKAGKANVLGEETGTCTLGAAGAGVQAREEGSAEITSGRACAQQRLAASCKDHPCEAMPKSGGGQRVWRMSPCERRARSASIVSTGAALLQRPSSRAAAKGATCPTTCTRRPSPGSTQTRRTRRAWCPSQSHPADRRRADAAFVVTMARAQGGE